MSWMSIRDYAVLGYFQLHLQLDISTIVTVIFFTLNRIISNTDSAPITLNLNLLLQKQIEYAKKKKKKSLMQSC